VDSEDKNVIELAIAGLASISVWVTLAKLLPRADPVLALRIASLNLEEKPRKPQRRLSLLDFLARLGRRLPGDPETVGRLLSSAGLESWPPEAVVGARVALALTAALFGLRLGAGAVIGVPLLAFGGYRLPDFLIKVRIRGRKEDLARELPDAIDLLVVCAQAGLNVALSLKRVAERAPGALGRELRRTMGEIELGVPRAQALTELAARCDVPDLQALVTNILGAERFGTRVVATLSNFSKEIRLKIKQREEERARRAPVKILFPLVFLILPGFVLLTLVPLLLGTFESLGF